MVCLLLSIKSTTNTSLLLITHLQLLTFIITFMHSYNNFYILEASHFMIVEEIFITVFINIFLHIQRKFNICNVYTLFALSF